MLVIRCLAALLLLTPVQATAQNSERLSKLKQLCIADEGVGFNWHNGQWEVTQFVSTKYVITKIDPPASHKGLKKGEERQAYARCTIQQQHDDDLLLVDVRAYVSCLKVQQLGENFTKFMPCWEAHTQQDDGDNWIVKFACDRDNLYFQPNGNFHYANIHGNVSSNPDDDYKDSLVIYIGKCANIAD